MNHSEDKIATVVVITHMEEYNLRMLLPSIPSCFEILVLDSFSSDQTCDVAKSFGASVHQTKFEDYSSQRNAAAKLASYDWIVSLDADEIPSTQLWQEITEFVKESKKDKVMRLQRRLFFMGAPIRWARSRDFPYRVFHREMTKFKGLIHESLDLSRIAESTSSKNWLMHYSYHSIEDYFFRFNRYTTLMARSRVEANEKIYFKWMIPFRLLIEFFKRYFIYIGFLDGFRGLVYSLLGSFYVFSRQLKMLESTNKKFESLAQRQK
jgi:glycosyltransferase involved in cell wall biosynthesis